MTKYNNNICKIIGLGLMLVLALPVTFAQTNANGAKAAKKLLLERRLDLKNYFTTDWIQDESADAEKTFQSSPRQNRARAASTVIANTSTNLPLIQVARQQGWIASTATQMTEGDAAKVTEIPDYCFQENENLTSFNEFQYFTSCKTIGYASFYACINLTSIILPEGVEKINAWAFALSGIKSIKIPSSVNSIGGRLFAFCDNLATIESDAGWLTIVNGALIANSTVLIAYPAKRTNSSTTIASGVESIRPYAFADNAYLTSVSFPTSLKVIQDQAFDNCENLDISTLPSSLTELGDYAFQNCAIKTISLGANLTTIGTAPFNNISTLTSISINTSNPNYSSDSGVLYDKNKTLLVQYPAGKTSTSYDIPTTVKTVGERALVAAEKLTMVSLPENLDSIGNYAFIGTTNISAVRANMPTPMKINEDCFYPCFSTATLYVPYGKKSLYQSTPYWSQFTNIVENQDNTVIATTSTNNELIKIARTQGWIASTATQMTKADAEKVTDISQAFAGNTSLTSFDEFQYFTSVTTLAKKNDNYGTFDGCSNLKSIKLPSSLTTIDTWAFYGCSNLTNVELPTSVTTIGSTVFYNCRSLSNITIPRYVSSIGSGCFQGCSSLTQINVNSYNSNYSSVNGVLFSYDMKTIIAYPAGKTSTTYSIPSGVTKVDSYCFYYCTKLTNITLPTTLQEIGYESFYGCNGLTSISLPSSLTTIGASGFRSCSKLTSITIPRYVTSIGNGAFGYCTELSSFSVNSSNTSYAAVDGVLYTYDKKTLIAYPNKKTSSYEILDGVTKLNESAFSGCSNLASITLPSSLTNIGSSVFSGCDNLSTITAKMTTPPAFSSEYVFPTAVYTNATLYVPQGRKSTYSSTNYWNKFTNIVELSSPGPTTIEFSQNGVTYTVPSSGSNETATVKRITADRVDLVIPSSVTYNGTTYNVTALGDSIFNNKINNYYIYSVTFPSTITTVAEKAFWWYEASTIVWNSNTPLPANSFSNSRYKDGNFLLYVKSANIAPSGVQNLVVNGTADEIVLKDQKVFNCPQSFTAKKISYTHNYQMETVIGESAGWETIALPFDVQTISHETKGELVPFAAYTSNSSKKPFWLYGLTSYGFAKASSIKANTPYIISMPNNSRYASNYILAGKVTFSSTNVTVNPTTVSSMNTATYNGGTFYPCYSFYSSSANNYAMNVTNDSYTYTGSERPGSVFKNSYRSVAPFEGRIYKSSASSPTFSIDFVDDIATGIEEILFGGDAAAGLNGTVKIYTLSGQLASTTTSAEAETVIKQLPAGVYIVNGKKIVKK